MIRIKNIKQGFTLLELLVVVLIIGILASIALPQYEKSVEKARLAEALLNIKAIEGSIQRYLLKNGYPDVNLGVSFEDFADIELSGGEWDEGVYRTKYFEYVAACRPNVCGIEVYRKNNPGNTIIYELGISHRDDISRSCFTTFTTMGEHICKYLESQGWEYVDDEF